MGKSSFEQLMIDLLKDYSRELKQLENSKRQKSIEKIDDLIKTLEEECKRSL